MGNVSTRALRILFAGKRGQFEMAGPPEVDAGGGCVRGDSVSDEVRASCVETGSGVEVQLTDISQASIERITVNQAKVVFDLMGLSILILQYSLEGAQ